MQKICVALGQVLESSEEWLKMPAMEHDGRCSQGKGK